MAIDTVRIKDLEEVSVNDLANLWMVVDSGTPDSTNKVKLSALAGYIGGQAEGRYIPLAGSSEITGSLLPKADKAIALGSGSFRWSALYSGEVHASDVLAIPTAAPSDPLPGEVYLYSGTGEYSETRDGGGGGDVYKLTLRKGSISLGVYDPAGPQDQTIDIAAAFSGYLTSVPAASSSDYGGFKYGDPIDTMLVMNNGYLAVDLVSLAATTQSIVDAAVAGLTPKVQAIPYIVGPDSDATAGTWHGTYEGITALTEGLTIVYVPHVAGATTTTLNINGLGAKTCYWTGTSKMTTQYPAGTPILLTYHNNGWRRADANTTYSAGTKALFDAGTNTSNRVWSASVLASAVAPIEHEHAWADINNAPAFITADALNGYATETYVGNQISALNLGTASQKDFTTIVAQNGADLPTSGAVYTAVNGKYTKPSTGIPKTDLASAVQTTLSNADTAYGWGNHASAGYLTSSSLDGYVNEIATGTGNYISGVSKSGKKLTFTYGTLPTTIAWTNVTGRPTALSDLTNDIISDWALASSKPTYTLDEVADGSTRKLSNYLPLSGGTLTGNLVAPAVRIANTYYGISFAKTTATPVETILYTGVKWVSSKHMPVIHITGYAYGLASPVELKIGFYIYSDKVIATGVTNMGAWAPDVYLFKYTNADSVDCVAVGLAGSCYFLQLQADVQDEMGKFANIIVDRSKWSWSFLTTTGTIPEADGGTTCIAVPYKADILSVAWSKVTGKPTTLSGYGITDAISAVTSTDNAVTRFNGTGGAIQNSGVLIDDSDNLSLPLGSSSSFSANPKLIIGNAWLGTNTAGALSYGIISGSAYNSYFAFEGTGLRPANSASAGDNKLNIGTSTVRFKDAYFGGTINTAGADISDSLSIPTDAPSSTTSGKMYLYASSLGEYAVEPWYGFNQLISNGNMESTTGWGTVYSGYTRAVENNVLTITITSATYRPQVRTALSVTNGHWVYYTYTMKYTTSAAYSDVHTAFLYPTPQYIPTGNQKDADYYNWKKISGIVKVNAAKTYLYIGRTAASSHTFAVGDTVQIKNVMVCDLTEMFGDENIPTVAQFEAMYPQDYYEYTPIGG